MFTCMEVLIHVLICLSIGLFVHGREAIYYDSFIFIQAVFAYAYAYTFVHLA